MPAAAPEESIRTAARLIREEGITQTEAAKRVGVSTSTLTRRFNALGIETTRTAARRQKSRPLVAQDSEPEPLSDGGPPPWLEDFTTALAGSAPPLVAAEFAGIRLAEFQTWLAKEANGEDWRRVLRAQGTSTVRLLANVCAQSDTQWQAAAWLLSHTRNDVIGQKVAVETRAIAPGESATTGHDVVMDMLEQLLGEGGTTAVLGRDLNEVEPADV